MDRKSVFELLLRRSHLHRNSNCLDWQQAQHVILSGRVGHFLLNQVRKVTDVIVTRGNFSSYAGKGQRRRWSVHTSESGQRKSETAATVAGGRRAPL